jgi:CubicO group peptidase (beta-lactamase class C family)
MNVRETVGSLIGSVVRDSSYHEMTIPRWTYVLTMLSLFFVQELTAFAFDSKLLEQKISEYIQAHEIVRDSGIAIAVIQDGKVIFSKGYGFRNYAQRLPVSENTLFAIGSNTKAFTSTALAMLRDEGRVDFRTPVRTYLPDFELSDSHAASEMTLEDILSHRTGLPRHDYFWYLTPFSGDDLYSRLRYLPFNSDPKMGFRKSFQYNNLMYMVAGRILEKLEGASWEEVIRRRILIPLQMKNTDVSVTVMQDAADHSLPYMGDREVPFKDLTSVAPAGAINSNLVDMEKWISFYISDGKTPDGARLISEDSLRALENPITDASFVFGNELAYGMGWFINAIDGQRLIWHGGNIDGFSAHMSLMPEKRLGLIILTNQNNNSVFEFPISLPAAQNAPERPLLPWVIYKYLLDPTQTIQSWPRGTARPAKLPPIIADPSNLEEYAGVYSDPAYGSLAVGVEGGHLAVDYFGHSYPMHSEAVDQFWFSIISGDGDELMESAFIRVNGQISGFSVPFEKSSKPIYFSKVRNCISISGGSNSCRILGFEEFP